MDSELSVGMGRTEGLGDLTSRRHIRSV